jgi:hypothetical protein
MLLQRIWQRLHRLARLVLRVRSRVRQVLRLTSRALMSSNNCPHLGIIYQKETWFVLNHVSFVFIQSKAQKLAILFF